MVPSLAIVCAGSVVAFEETTLGLATLKGVPTLGALLPVLKENNVAGGASQMDTSKTSPGPTTSLLPGLPVSASDSSRGAWL